MKKLKEEKKEKALINWMDTGKLSRFDWSYIEDLIAEDKARGRFKWIILMQMDMIMLSNLRAVR